MERRLYSVAEARRLARRALPGAIFDFVDGGAEDERTLRRNEAAFAELGLLPRPLDGTTARDQSLMLFGQRLTLPVIVGPTGLSGLLWPDGELATARAAARGRHRLLPEPRLDLHHRGTGCRCRGPALDADLHVPGP